MSALGGGMSFMGNMPDSYNLVVNTNHPLINEIVDAADDDKKDKLAQQMFDLALLSQNLLKGEKLAQFIKRSIDFIGK